MGGFLQHLKFFGSDERLGLSVRRLVIRCHVCCHKQEMLSLAKVFNWLLPSPIDENRNGKKSFFFGFAHLSIMDYS